MSGSTDKGTTLMLKLANTLWVLLVGLLVLFAVYVSAGRLLVGMVDSYQGPLLRTLGEQLPVQLEAREVAAHWRGFQPQFILQGLSLHSPGEDAASVALGEGRVTVDVWGSLRSGGLRVSRLVLVDLDLQGELTASGEFRLLGFGANQGRSALWLQDVLLDLERVTLLDNRLQLRLPGGGTQQLDVDLNLLRDGSRRQLRARLLSAGGTAITLLADGLGNPFDSADYNGDVHARMQVEDLSRLAGWHPAVAGLPVALAGSGSIEVWLDWQPGEPVLDLRVDSRDLRLSGGETEAWSLPLDRLAATARLRREQGGWRLAVQDLAVGRGELRLAVPRLQAEQRGDSLRVRAADMPLASLQLLAGRNGVLPDALGEALRSLVPAGRLPAVELRLEDTRRPAQGWRLAAHFSEVALDSWRGAPGVRQGAGYLQLGPGGGQLWLDSSPVTLAFPTVYREPLAWDSLQGRVDLHWDREALRLESGLLTATGEEGTARALFGLDVPLQRDRGDIDMQLLVGLRDADPVYRRKYLPYTLPDGLLDWLSDSLEGGHVREGGFVWRGSLRPGAAAERTVQLFFEVANTRLRFDPRWPALTDLYGTVLIDDTRVSLWSDQARLFDSELTQLSGETWRDPGGALRLAVSAELQGGVGDGLRVLNQSPLAEPLAGALADWHAEGALHARVHLNMPLVAGSAPIAVDLRARVEGANLQIRPGGLELEDLGGTVRYATETGFAGEDIRARLWGQPLALEVRQDTGRPSGLAPGPVHLDLRGQLGAQALAGWLDYGGALPVRGETEVRGTLSFAAGDAPRLSLASGLQGIALDLPFPLDKAAGEELPFSLTTALGGESLRLDLKAGRRASARLGLRGGRLEAASVALQDRPLPLRPGLLRLSGHLPELRLADWQSLVGDSQPGAGGLTPRVEDLQVDTFLGMGQDWVDVILNLDRQPDHWHIAGEAQGIKGHARLLPQGPGSSVTLEALDLASLGGGAGSSTPVDPAQWADLPDLEVEIRQLYRRGRSLGQLAFDLGFADDGVHATRLQGQFPGLGLAPGQPARLHWHSGGTRLQLGLRVGDLGETLEALAYQRVLETRGGVLGLDLQWPGSPAAFALSGSDGVLRIDLRDGRFLDAPPSAAGTLRVVSILNLADLIQRLSLTQVFESGISFDRLQGEMLVQNGRIRVPELELASAGSALVFSGESDIAQRRLSGELVATLPVASNLPWVAALAGGLPMAAGVYVVSKLFKKQVSQLSSAVYRLGGTWDNPEFRLDRLFDLSERDQGSSPSSSAPVEDAETSSQ